MDEDNDSISLDEETLKSVPKLKRERTEAQKANDQKNREFLLAKHQAIRDEKRKKEEEKIQKDLLKQQKAGHLPDRIKGGVRGTTFPDKEEAVVNPSKQKQTIKVVTAGTPRTPQKKGFGERSSLIESEDDDVEQIERPESPESPVIPPKKGVRGKKFPDAKPIPKPRTKKNIPPPPPVSEDEDEYDDDVEEEEEEYIPPPPKPRRQMTQHIQQHVPQQYYAPVPQRVRPIITYV